MDTLLRDLRYAIRGLRRTPAFTVSAVLALALGIGATTAIFSVVHGVLLRSLGYPDESRLVWISAEERGLNWHNGPLSAPEVMDLRQMPELEASGAFRRKTAALQADRAERVEVAAVSHGFFEALQIHPRYGRTFTAAEDLKGNDGVALISWNAFRRRYAMDPSIVGKSVTLDGIPRQIIGVLPEGFSYGGDRDYYLPFGWTQEDVNVARGFRYLEVIGRMKPGVTLDGLRRALKSFGDRLISEHPNNYPADFGWGLSANPLRERFVAASREPLVVLFSAVLLVLLIACANVANLLLARASQRGRELAVRAAIGAGRVRIVRELLTEGFVLALLGTLLGVVVAEWGLSALVASAPRDIRDLAAVRLNGPVLAFAVGLSFLTTVAFALVPALRASKIDLASSLKGGMTGAHATRLRSVLVAAQVAISLVLLAGAGLLLRSFARVLSTSPGMDPEGAISAVLSPAGPAYDTDAARVAYFQRALQAAAAIPGVQVAGGGTSIPYDGRLIQQTYTIEGYALRAGEPNPTDIMRMVMPDYFGAIRQPVVRGRAFTAADDAKAPPVVVVNEAWVRRYLPGREPVGARIRIDDGPPGQPLPFRTIVGVAGDTREEGLDKPAPPIFYVPAVQHIAPGMTVVVRGKVSPNQLRETLSAVDPTQPVDRVQPLTATMESSLSQRRFPLQLLECFAVLALLLSAVGIYGVTAYAVAQRTRELGVRLAIGATGGQVLRLVLGRALLLALLGVGIGVALAAGGARLIASQLYGVSAADPLTYAAVIALLGFTTLLASAMPAWRAARIDPMTALRAE
jgi:putative ABC transport system permease protein